MHTLVTATHITTYGATIARTAYVSTISFHPLLPGAVLLNFPSHGASLHSRWLIASPLDPSSPPITDSHTESAARLLLPYHSAIRTPQLQTPGHGYTRSIPAL